jgi:hypothetical protein
VVTHLNENCFLVKIFEEMTVVQLLVYDLSRGMAAQMSEAMLGRRIEGIWHTGVSVFQYEYFFGGGMQKVPLGIFSAQNNLQPVSVLDMGTTSKSQAELEAFLRTISSRFVRPIYFFTNNNSHTYALTIRRRLPTIY